MSLFHRKKKNEPAPPQQQAPAPAAAPAWTSAQRPTRAPAMEIGRQRPGLTAQENTQLTAVQKSLVGRKAREINMHRADFSLTTAQREKPQEEAASTGENVYNAASGLYGKVVSDVGTPAIDSASAAVDFAGGGKTRTFQSIGQKTDANGEDIWGDGSMQSDGISVGSSVTKSVGLIFDTVEYVKKLVGFIKDSKDERAQETGDSAVSKAEKADMFLATVEIIQKYLDTAMSWAGAFTTALGRLPIVGAIIGAIDSGMSFVVDAVQWYQAEKYIAQMREQKAAAKGRIQGGQGVFGREVSTGRMEERKSGLIHRHTEEKFKVSRTYEATTDEGTNKSRAMRLDEKTKQLRGANGGALTQAQEEAVRDLEDYDITKELTSANKKRRREGVTDLVFKDAVGFGAALANLDPTGMGSAVGAAVTAAVGVGYLGKSVGSYIRQKARNHGFSGADLNKSEENKKQRRHNLAVIMYDRIMELADTQVASITDPANVTQEQRTAINSGAMQKFDKMNERINAMGVAGPFLRAHTAPEMVKVMRQGFYRDSG